MFALRSSATLPTPSRGRLVCVIGWAWRGACVSVLYSRSSVVLLSSCFCVTVANAPSQVCALGTEDTGVFKMSCFSSALDFCDIVCLSSLHVVVLVLQNRLIRSVYNPSFQTLGPTRVTCTFSFMAQLHSTSFLSAFLSPCTPPSLSDPLNKDRELFSLCLSFFLLSR